MLVKLTAKYNPTEATAKKGLERKETSAMIITVSVKTTYKASRFS